MATPQKIGASKPALPEELKKVREAALQALLPIKSVDENTIFPENFWVKAGRTAAGRNLPPYYLVYFLLVDLLNFENLGKSEKVAWSVPIDLDGKGYAIEYRKLGLGIFVPNAKNEEKAARRIVGLIKKAVAIAEPYYAWRAEQSVQASELNVKNNCGWLFDRYQYLRDRSREVFAEKEARKNERHREVKENRHGTVTTITFPWMEINRNARWLALSAIEAFFSWTEHVFIHLAILQGRVTTGIAVADLAEKDWTSKFKQALDVSNPTTKAHFDKLLMIRRQLRNFVAHGAFGKRGEAFHFHSGTGAVPVILTHESSKNRFSLTGEIDLDEANAIATIEAFIDHLWSGTREPARIYLQESGLPVILTMASNGAYAAAMQSIEDMKDFVYSLSRQFDDAANMDW